MSDAARVGWASDGGRTKTDRWIAIAALLCAVAACSKKSDDPAASNAAGSGQAAIGGSAGSVANSSGANGSVANGSSGNSAAAGSTVGGASGSTPSTDASVAPIARDSGAAIGGNGGRPPAEDAGLERDSGAPPADAGDAQPPFKGVANSPCNVRKALGVSWYYNWGQSESEACSDGMGGAFVPMIWGHTGDEQKAERITSSVASFVSKGYSHVLGFNEPDNPSQSNVPVATAIKLWPAFDNPKIEVVSPGTAANANPGQAWFSDFMSQLNGDAKLRADALAIHWYGWNAGSCDANAGGLENYIKWAEKFAGDRPIWITEWGCLNQSAPDEATVLKFYQGALAVFARHPRIERYAWYPWATNCHLANDDGSLTALGKAYAAAPAYK